MLLGDFYYADIEYDPINQVAIRLQLCEPVEFRPGSFFWASRDQVIHLIKDGYTVEPMPKTDQPQRERHLVRLVTLDGQTYLRTDTVALPADRLNGNGDGHHLK